MPNINIIKPKNLGIYPRIIIAEVPKSGCPKTGITEINIKNRQKNIYLCMFENLIKNPETESRKIRDFLHIKQLGVFEPKDFKKVELTEDIAKKILNDTQVERKFFGYS